ncbi:MAG: phenylalanyl-tRNA synthetase beta chain, partial [Bacteroidia bacterium]
GLEVEKLVEKETIPGGLKGLVIGEVLTCQPHPNADKLSLTTVRLNHSEEVQIVCGAPNVAAGQKVVVAPVNCTIYPANGEPFKIKKAKIRGEVSEGMICAEDEIGLGTGHDGILVLPQDAPLGAEAAKYFDVQADYQIEIGLTPNRGEATSHVGVARDIRAINGKALVHNKYRFDAPQTSPIKIDVQTLEGCPRYCGVSLRNVVVGESPAWLKEKLQSINLKPINNVVDVTNYVLHHLGQPIHAFDLDKIGGDKIVVRMSNKGEKLTTLDEVERELTGNEMVIADASKPLAIAGVFGGLHSGVTSNTKNIFIESAYFDPAVVRKGAKTHGLNTDASFRYERGCDPNLTIEALNLVVHLLQESCGATPSSAVIDTKPEGFDWLQIQFNNDWLNRFCGTNLPTEETKSILQRLDIEVVTIDGSGFIVKVPPFRSEVTRDVDLAEEVLRIYGFNKVEMPSTLRIDTKQFGQQTITKRSIQNKTSKSLTGLGFLEIMNNSQTREEWANVDTAVRLLNPLSNEYAVMRTSLLPGALQAIGYNVNRKNKNLQFFEFGKTYGTAETGFIEKQHLFISSTGLTNEKNWITNPDKSDFFFVSGIVTGLFNVHGIAASRMQDLVTFGKAPKKDALLFGIKQEVCYADIDWKKFVKLASKVKFNLEEVPVYPVVERDLSVVLDPEQSYAQLEGIVQKTCGKYYRGCTVFSVYEGENLPDGKKSYAISYKLYDSNQTLQDKVIDTIQQRLIANLEKELDALIRK